MSDRLLSAEAMKAADSLTISELGLPGRVLMELAGKASAEVIEHHYGPIAGKTIAVLCGKGNNGGDGFVIARWLSEKGAEHVHVLCLATDPADLADDAAANLETLQALGAGNISVDMLESDSLPAVDLFVDALLGIGVTRPVEGVLGEVLRAVGATGTPVVAVDIPTGLHTDTGSVCGTVLKADLTVTMAGRKAGHVLGDGPACCGKVVVVDIGIPRGIMQRVAEQYHLPSLIDRVSVRKWLPQRDRKAHKYSAGMVLAIAGSPGLTGAPFLASQAALRAGAGAVVCACDARTEQILAGRFTEVMTLPLPAGDDGIDPSAALDRLEKRLGQARSLLVGPGLGRDPSTVQFIHQLLEGQRLPAVIDADGLNALIGRMDIVARNSGGQWVLTPHEGEFRRLAGDDLDLADRVAVTARFAREWNCILLLKGQPSIVADASGRILVADIVDPALATAGAGDVLAGIIASLITQGMPSFQAAAAALHLGGTAASVYSAEKGSRAMIASDLVGLLPDAFQSINEVNT
jgi:ADP-dependent NAD(P)H-hydrate dehydratase / NAD(P)H-hydrate epimerase